MEVHIATVSTNKTIGLDNFLCSLSQNGYQNVHIVGQGEKWINPGWKILKYLELLRKINSSNRLFCLVDSNDLFFVRGPNALIEAYQKCGSDVIISAERNPTVEGSTEFFSKVNSPFRYPNSGMLCGTGDALISILEKCLDTDNDQTELTLKLMRGEIEMGLDTKGQIAATIPFATADWKFNDFDLWKIQDGVVKSKIFNTMPVIVHFPGKIPIHYNNYLEKLYPDLRKRTWDDSLKRVNRFQDEIVLAFYNCIPC